MKTRGQGQSRHFVIAGGGTSGWMAAALMSRLLIPAGHRITVLEPPGPRGIGVGEASVVSILALLRTLQADEREMMQRCEATYKLGIQFCDWLRPGHENWHPFGVCGAWIDNRDLFSCWYAEKMRTGHSNSYHSYSLQWLASVAGKGPHSRTVISPLTQTQSYAFHFNAEALACWLREQALAGGVQEIQGTAAGAQQNERGDITQATLTTGECIAGDFFVDCTGFNSVLMHGALQDPFHSWNHQLLCDRAVAVKIPGGRVIPPFTKSQALQAGWMWHIPLARHTGLGYVYSSQFASDEDAWRQLRQAAGALTDSEVTPRFLKMRVGRQSHFWKHNVLAVGLSAGFLEPLESSGIHLSQAGLELFLRLLPSGDDWTAAREHYNRRMASIYDEVRDFVQMHYWLSQRSDTPFWIAARNAKLSPELSRRIEIYDDAGALDTLQPEAFSETSYYHLLTGNHRFPKRVSPVALSLESAKVQEILGTIQQQNEQALRDLPLHEELLDFIHLPAVARAS